MKYILGLLNSNLYNFIHANTHNSTYISFPSIEALPYIEASPSQKQRVVKLVEKILEEKEKGVNNNTTTYEKQIDQIVYQLFELSDKEISIIENSKYSET